MRRRCDQRNVEPDKLADLLRLHQHTNHHGSYLFFTDAAEKAFNEYEISVGQLHTKS